MLFSVTLCTLVCSEVLLCWARAVLEPVCPVLGRKEENEMVLQMLRRMGTHARVFYLINIILLSLSVKVRHRCEGVLMYISKCLCRSYSIIGG